MQSPLAFCLGGLLPLDCLLIFSGLSLPFLYAVTDFRIPDIGCKEAM